MRVPQIFSSYMNLRTGNPTGGVSPERGAPRPAPQGGIASRVWKFRNGAAYVTANLFNGRALKGSTVSANGSNGAR